MLIRATQQGKVTTQFGLRSRLSRPRKLRYFPPNHDQLFQCTTTINDRLRRFNLPHLIAFTTNRLFTRIHVPVNMNGDHFVHGSSNVMRVAFLRVFQQDATRFHFLHFHFASSTTRTFARSFSVVSTSVASAIRVMITGDRSTVNLNVRTKLKRMAHDRVTHHLTQPMWRHIIRTFYYVLEGFGKVNRTHHRNVGFLFSPVREVFQVGLTTVSTSHRKANGRFVITSNGQSFHRSFFSNLDPTRCSQRTFHFFVQDHSRFYAIHFGHQHHVMGHVTRYLGPNDQFHGTFSWCIRGAGLLGG